MPEVTQLDGEPLCSDSLPVDWAGPMESWGYFIGVFFFFSILYGMLFLFLKEILAISVCL